MGGYLICDNCNEYYELQPGELPADFTDKCNCGGNLRFVNNIEGLNENKVPETKQIDNNSKIGDDNKQYIKESSIIPPQNKNIKVKTPRVKSNLFPCPDCGHEISKNATKCSNCGRQLTERDKGKTDYFTICIGCCVLVVVIAVVYGIIYNIWYGNPYAHYFSGGFSLLLFTFN